MGGSNFQFCWSDWSEQQPQNEIQAFDVNLEKAELSRLLNELTDGANLAQDARLIAGAEEICRRAALLGDEGQKNEISDVLLVMAGDANDKDKEKDYLSIKSVIEYYLNEMKSLAPANMH